MVVLAVVHSPQIIGGNADAAAMAPDWLVVSGNGRLCFHRSHTFSLGTVEKVSGLLDAGSPELVRNFQKNFKSGGFRR